MSQINMSQVKELRERTQAGLNDCRSALQEAAGDMEKAVEIILKKGLAKSAKRAGAVATEGVVAARVAADARSGVIVEVNIQTDFAARNEDFLRFVALVVTAAESAKAGADLTVAPNPEGAGTVEDARAALVGRLGENVTIRRWDRVDLDRPGKVHAYVHLGGKVGALLAVGTATPEAAGHEAVSKFVDDTAMQIAAMAPISVGRDDVPAEAKAKQAEIYLGQLAEEGKTPEDKRPKIVEGKVQKWLKEVCLLEQQSVLEPDKTVEQLRAAVAQAAGGELVVLRFARFERGEGIQKPSGPDFADEVARMAGG